MSHSRYYTMWRRAFEARFLELRSQGVSEDLAIWQAEHDADVGLSRYVDDKLEERKLGD